MISKLIKEEISSFDFLSLNKIEEEDKHNQILNSKEFQTSFIMSLINDLNNQDVFPKKSIIYSNTPSDDLNEFDLEKDEYEMELEYFWNGSKYKLILMVNGEEKEYNLNLYNVSGEKIKIDWIKDNKNLYSELINSINSQLN